MRPLPPLIDGEHAWSCAAVAVEAGRVVGPAEMDAELRSIVEANARRLYLEVADRDDRSVWLIHRGGWPFDLRTFDDDPTGKAPPDLRPVGAGDEVMRDLIDSVEAAAPGRSLHVRGQTAR